MVMGPMTANVTMHAVTHRKERCESSSPDGRFIPNMPASSVPCVRGCVRGEAAYNKLAVCESARDRPHPLRRPFESLHSHKHMLVRLIYKLLVTSVNRYCCPRRGEVKRGGLHILFVSDSKKTPVRVRT